MQPEQEHIRQDWLHAMGLTPWASRNILPGAKAPTFLLDADTTVAKPTASNTAPEHQQASPSTAVEDAAAPNTAAPAHQSLADALADAPERAPTSAPQTQKDQTPPDETAAPHPPVLAVCLVGSVLVIAEQKDPELPDMTPAEHHLLNNIMQLFGNEQKRFPFKCLATPTEAQDTLSAFIGALAYRGCDKVLFLLSDTGMAHLTTAERFTPFTLAKLPALAIHSLALMLEDPVPTKKASWQGLCEAGFV